MDPGVDAWIEAESAQIAAMPVDSERFYKTADSHIGVQVWRDEYGLTINTPGSDTPLYEHEPPNLLACLDREDEIHGAETTPHETAALLACWFRRVFPYHSPTGWIVEEHVHP